MQAFIAYSLFFILYLTGRVKSLCYTDTNCTMSTVPAIDQADCCIGTNDGLAYSDDSGNCIECIGKILKYHSVATCVISDSFSSSWIC